METLIGLLLAASPIVLTVVLLVGSDRRQRRVHAEIGRQIALTDALHAKLGAVVAPVVRRRRGLWRVSVAIPAEGPALVSVVLATVDEVLGPAAYELRLRRQAEPAPAVPSSRATRPVGELSWI